MQPVTYSWIGLSAAAPLVFLICAWVLGIYHSFRKYWRSVDLFLLAIFVQELLTALLAFIFALLSLMKPSSEVLCGAFIWSLSAIRVLQAGTVCSLLVDRALTSQWPYKYRFSVRRHQIRYHLVVLATMASLVGVAAILAKPSETSSNFEDCKFLPHSLHVRLALFLLSLYGILLVIAAISASVVQTTRTCKGGTFIQGELHQDMTPITHGTTGSRGTTGSSTTESSVRAPIMQGGRAGPPHPLTCSSSTASSTSSGARLHSSTTDLLASPKRIYPSHSRMFSKVPLSRKSTRTPLDEFRWGASIAVAALCFLVNHIPYMILLAIGTFFPYLLPDWPMENLSLWMSIFEGLLLPLVLGLCDFTFGEAALNSCSSRQKIVYDAEPESPFRMKDEVKAFPLTNGSLFSSLHTMNIDCNSPFYQKSPNHFNTPMSGTRMGMMASQHLRSIQQQNHPESFRHFLYSVDEPSSLSSMERQDPIYSDPLNKAYSIDSSLKDDHIYATLSETYGSYSSFSEGYLADQNRCSSATTVANDDFEYHAAEVHLSPTNIRPTEVFRPKAVLPPEVLTMNVNYVDLKCSKSSSSDSSCRTSTSSDLSNSSTFELDSSRVIDIQSPPTENGLINQACNDGNLRLLPKRYFGDTIKSQESSKPDLRHSYHIELSPQITDNLKDPQNTLSRKHRSSSLSMNDLNHLESKPMELDQEEEMMFILPVKSESMLSLYKLYLAEDEDSGVKSLRYSIEVSKSDGNLAESLSSSSAIEKPVTVSANGKFQKQDSVENEPRRRVTAASGSSSKIRRQHKIMKAKGNIYRAKHSSALQENPVDINCKLSDCTTVNKKDFSSGVEVTVMDKYRKKNGIITIKDPSVLSVEELFNVLGRASKKQQQEVPKITTKSFSQNLSDTEGAFNQPTHASTDFKKIFVSEYI